MKKGKLFLFVIAIITAGFILWALQIDKKQKVPSQILVKSLSPQTNSEGAVSVEVTPPDVSKDIWNFEITLDTHSGNLDQDLLTSVVLVDNKGKEFKAITWDGDPPQGHHRKGNLKFTAVSPLPKSIELRFKNLGESEKIFKWDLDQ